MSAKTEVEYLCVHYAADPEITEGMYSNES